MEIQSMLRNTILSFSFIFFPLILISNPLVASSKNEGITCYQNEDYECALQKLMPHATKGDPLAQRLIGRLYFNGISSCDTPEEITKGFGKKPSEVLKCEDYIAVFENEEEVKSLQPDLNILSQLECRGVLVTAKGDNTDFVSRFFAPRCGISEDPVTGSAHCSLTPYWVAKLGKNKLTAIQLSARGGKLNCELEGSRVKISGKAVKYLEGTIEI